MIGTATSSVLPEAAAAVAPWDALGHALMPLLLGVSWRKARYRFMQLFVNFQDTEWLHQACMMSPLLLNW